MKRSEMIKILQDYFDNSDIFNPETIGEDILNKVEELGMLPPDNCEQKTCKKYEDDSYCGNQWEPEDE